METNGYYILKYNNKYYNFFKRNECHPEGLGSCIVNELRQMSADELIEIKNLLNKIKYTTCNGPCIYTSLRDAVIYPLKYAFHISSNEPELYIRVIHYIYTVDFDNKTFNVKWYTGCKIFKETFDMHNIPLEWAQRIVQE